jgi:hypothetical protein
MKDKLTVNELKALANRTKLSAKFIATSGVTGPRLKQIHAETSSITAKKNGLRAIFGLAAATGAGVMYEGFTAQPVWWDTMALGIAGAGIFLMSSVAFLVSMARPANYAKAHKEITDVAEKKRLIDNGVIFKARKPS